MNERGRSWPRVWSFYQTLVKFIENSAAYTVRYREANREIDDETTILVLPRSCNFNYIFVRYEIILSNVFEFNYILPAY